MSNPEMPSQIQTVTHAEQGRGKRKDASFETINAPEEFPDVHFTVDTKKLVDYAFAQGDYGSWYFKDSPFGEPIGHPLLMANDLLFLFYETYDGNTAKGLHSHEKLWFHSPVQHGERVTVSGRYTEKYVNRGHGCVVLDAKAYGEDGRLLVHHRGTEVMSTRVADVSHKARAEVKGQRVEGKRNLELPVAKYASLDLPPLSPVVSSSSSFTQNQLNTFSWLARGYRNIHTDIDAARESGSGRTVVQALQQTGLLTKMLVDFFGETWFTDGHLDLRYVSPAYCEERLTAHAAVLGPVEQSGNVLELEVWIDAEDGRRTALGWARCRVGEDPSRPEQLINAE